MEEKNKVLCLSCGGIALAWLPWFNYSAVLPILKGELGLTSSDSGTVLGAFQLGYVISVLTTGWLADRFGRKKVLIASAFFTGTASLGFVFFARDFWSILLWRVLVGMGCGGTYAPGLALLSNWFSAKERGKAFGAYTGASVTAFAASYFIAAPVAAATSWQYGILATSLPVFVAVVAFSFVTEQPESRAGYLLASGRTKSYTAPRELQLAPLALVTLAYMAHMWEQFAFWGWAGAFFTTASLVRGMEMKEAVATGGVLAALVVLVGTTAPWLGGAASDKFERIRTASLFAFASMGLSFSIGWLVGQPLALIAAVALIYGFVVVADSAIYKASFSEIIPARYLASGLAVQSALGFGAAIFSPKIFGMVLDATNPSSFQTVWGWAFASLGLGALFSPICLAVFKKYMSNRKF